MADPKELGKPKIEQPKPKPKAETANANVVFEAKADAGSERKSHKPPKIRIEFQWQIRESPIAKAFSGVELTDGAAAIINDFIETRPPDRQLKADLGLRLAEDIYAGFKTGAISSPTEAIKAMSVVRAIYGGVDSQQLVEFNGYLEKIIAQGEVSREGLEETVKILGQAAVRKDIENNFGLETAIELGKANSSSSGDISTNLQDVYELVLKTPELEAGQRYVSEAESEGKKSQELHNYLQQLIDEYGIDPQVANEYFDVVNEAATRKDVENIAVRLKQATSELYNQLPQNGTADEVFLNTQVEVLKKLAPLQTAKLGMLVEALNTRPPNWDAIRSARGELIRSLPKNELVKIPAFLINSQTLKLLLDKNDSLHKRTIVSQTLKENPDQNKLKNAVSKLNNLIGGKEGVVGNRELNYIKGYAAEVVNIRVAGKGVETNFIRNLGLVGSEGAAIGPDFYDPSNPGSATSDKAKVALASIQYSLEHYPENMADYDFLKRIRQDLGSPTKFSQEEVGPYVDKLKGFERSAYEAYSQLQELEQPFSEFYLSAGEIRGLRIDPLWQVDRFAQRVEENAILFPDTPTAQAAQARLRVMTGYINSDQFLRDAKRWTEQDAFRRYNAISGETVEQYLARMELASKQVSEKITFREKAQSGYGYFRGTGDPDKLGDSLLVFGIRGKEFILNEYGGLTQDAYDRFNAALNQVIYDPKTGEKRRIEGRLLAEARAIAEREFLADKELYKHKIDRAFKYRTDENGVPIEGIQDSDIRAALRLGEYISVLTFQEAAAMHKGLGPGEKSLYSDINSFATASTTEMVLMAWDPKKWFFDKWHNLDEGKHVMWDNISFFAALAHGRAPEITERVSRVSHGSKAWKDLVIEAFGFSGADARGNKKIDEHAIEDFFERESKRKAIDTNWMERLGRKNASEALSNENLVYALMLKEGGQISGRLLHMYDYFSSGWRGETYLNQIEEIWDYGKHLGLGIRLKQKGGALYNAESKVVRGKAADETIAVLGEVAKFRPQAILQFLYDGGDQVVPEWIRSQGGLLDRLEIQINVGRNGARTPLKLDRADRIYNFVTRRFLTINSLLAERGLDYIDYSLGPTAEQRVIVDQVCQSSGMQTNPDDYLELMKNMSQFSGRKDLHEKLTKDKYYYLYERTQWVDDLRLNYLEDPNNAPGRKELTLDEEDYKPRAPISTVFIDKGQGRGDPLVRGWKDTKLGVDAVIALYEALTPKKDDYFKALKIIYPNIKTYSGSKPIAGRAMINIMAGVGMTYKSEDLYNLFLMGDLPAGSQLKRLYGSLAESYSPNELWHFMEEHNIELNTELKSVAPELYDAALKYLHITGLTGEYLGLERGGLYFDRVKLFVLISALIIGTGVATTGLATIKEEFKE